MTQDRVELSYEVSYIFNMAGSTKEERLQYQNHLVHYQS